MVKLIKVRIPAQVVWVDAEKWATEYGKKPEEVRDDVKSYFTNASSWLTAEGFGH